MYITTIPDERYNFKGDSAEGRFLLKIIGDIKADEIYGTLGGYDGNKISFESKDKSISVKMKVSEMQDYGDVYLGGTATGLRNGFEDEGAFSKTCVNTTYARKLEELPFTLTLSDDKTEILLNIKEGFKPDGWYYSYASYGNSDKDVYTRFSSKYSDGETVLPLCTEADVNHNLQFYYYSSSPYATDSLIDIMFVMTDGEIFYNCCNEYLTCNENYHGNEGAEMVEKYFAAREKSMFLR